jgi:hypothetical protein
MGAFAQQERKQQTRAVVPADVSTRRWVAAHRLRSGRKLEDAGDLRKRRFLCITYLDAAESKKAALGCGLGNVLGDQPQPTLERRRITGCLGV